MASNRAGNVKTALLTEDDVVAAEHDVIGALRERPVLPDGESKAQRTYLNQQRFPTMGLALSGGGIRSASFCLGALQALSKHDVFKRFDYLSTVSGGGYVGIATCAHQLRSGGVFPWFDKTEHKDTAEVQRIRDKANYLRFGNLMSMLENGAIYLRGVLVNILLALPVLLGLAAVTLLLNPTADAMRTPGIPGITDPGHAELTGWFPITLLAGAAALLFFWSWAVATIRGVDAGLANKSLPYAKWIVSVLCVFLFIELQPLLISKMIGDKPPGKALSCPMSDIQFQCTQPDGKGCKLDSVQMSCETIRVPAKEPDKQPNENTQDQRKISDAIDRLSAWLLGYITPLLAVLAFVSQHLGSFLKSDKDNEGFFARLRRRLGTSMVWAGAALLLPALCWLSYLVLVLKGLGPDDGKIHGVVYASIYLGLAAILFLASFSLSPNANSIHRLYRDRLGQAFLYGELPKKVPEVKTEPLEKTPFSALAGQLPFLIVNSALNVQRDAEVNKRGRNADSFIMTPLHLGSKATGYVTTLDYENSGLDKDLDIATAMAISGAAASSNMGSKTMRPLRWALAFFNVRLGYWLENPRKLTPQADKLQKVWFYFLQELRGQLHSKLEKIYLTDGGHMDNLGLYELLRRRCRLIMVVDAEADPEMTFPSFIDLQRHARIDLGAKIDLNWQPISEATRKAMAGGNGGGTAPHCAIGKIEYENGPPGILVYVKSSLTGDENDSIKDYNRRYRAFPHESTGDQFFSEEQFEVYRALGFHSVNGLLSGKSKAVTLKGKLESLRSRGSRSFGYVEAARLLGV